MEAAGAGGLASPAPPALPTAPATSRNKAEPMSHPEPTCSSSCSSLAMVTQLLTGASGRCPGVTRGLEYPGATGASQPLRGPWPGPQGAFAASKSLPVTPWCQRPTRQPGWPTAGPAQCHCHSWLWHGPVPLHGQLLRWGQHRAGSAGARTPCDITALPHASVTPLVTSPPCLPQRQQNRLSPEGAQRAWKMASQPTAVKHSQEQGAHQEQAWCHQCCQCHSTAPRREFLGTASPLGLRRSCRHKGNGVLSSLLSSPDPAGKGQQEVSAAPQFLQSLCSKQISISQGALTAPPLLWFAVG